MPEQQITRAVVVVVDKVDKNTYGDLTFTDKDGANYKVSAKRIQYFEKIIQPNTAVELSYAMSSFGKEYIYSAKQVKDYLPPPQEAKPVPDLPPPLPKEYLAREAVKAGATVILDQNEIKNRAVAISYSKDLAVAGKIELKQLKEYADKFLAYIKGEAL